MGAMLRWETDANFSVEGTRFHCAFPKLDPPEGYLPILKDPAMVPPYEAIISELHPARVMELGIRHGGSTALLYELTKSDLSRLVAIELDADRAEALDRFIRDHELDDVIRPHYGVDQADRSRLAELVDEEFGGEPLDLVVDDASHLYDPTVASFETLFPRLRPGGLYIIEDWTSYYLGLNTIADELEKLDRQTMEDVTRDALSAGITRPKLLALLTVQLVLMRAVEANLVEKVSVDRYWTVVERGDAEISPDSFRVDDSYYDHMSLFAGDWD